MLRVVVGSAGSRTQIAFGHDAFELRAAERSEMSGPYLLLSRRCGLSVDDQTWLLFRVGAQMVVP